MQNTSLRNIIAQMALAICSTLHTMKVQHAIWPCSVHLCFHCKRNYDIHFTYKFMNQSQIHVKVGVCYGNPKVVLLSQLITTGIFSTRKSSPYCLSITKYMTSSTFSNFHWVTAYVYVWQSIWDYFLLMNLLAKDIQKFVPYNLIIMLQPVTCSVLYIRYLCELGDTVCHIKDNWPYNDLTSEG